MKGKSYVLKLYDDVLMRFEAEAGVFGVPTLSISYINEEKLPLFPIRLLRDQSADSLWRWLQSRVIPKNREFVDKLLTYVGLSMGDTLGVIDVCRGLSVNDAFWVDQAEDEKNFAEVNLYDNDLDTVLAYIAYTGYTSSQKHAAGLSSEWTTSGMYAKAWRRIDDKLYLYKAGSHGYANAGMEPYSEYFAVQLADAFGIDAVPYDLKMWHVKLASTCQLLNDKDTAYVPAYPAMDAIDFPSNLAYMAAFSGEALETLRSMLVFDALLANPDRHGGNYGFLRNNHTGKIIGFAPLFDHNNALFCQEMSEDFDDFARLANTKYGPSCTGLSFLDQCKAIMGSVQHEQLRRVIDFQFENHPEYPVPEERLTALNHYIQARCKELLAIPVVEEREFNESVEQAMASIHKDAPLLVLK